MKKILAIIAITAAALLSLASCQKETPESTDGDESVRAERIISGAFANNGTKTSLDTDNKTPLWKVGDRIRVLDGTAYQDVTLVANGSTPGTNEGVISVDSKSFTFSTSLAGTLYAVYPASATTMESCTDGNVTFTVPSVQDGTFGSANICVASGDGSTANTIYFSNATAVVEMTVATGVVGAKFAATNNVAGDMTVTMGSNGAISNTTTTSLSSTTISVSDTKAPIDSKFYLAVAPVDAGTVTITCNTTTKFGSIDKGTKTLAMDKIYATDLSGMTINTDFDLTGQRGILNGQEYVLIKAKYDGTNDSYLKWATQNLAVTVSGKAKWKSTNYVIGDYFQWAASYDGYGITEAVFKTPENLVIYDSFTNTCAGGGSDSFNFKAGKTFAEASAPYYNSGSSSYTKYTGGAETLDLTDDVANIVLGGTWRMPTGGSADQFTKMRAATYWAWDSTDIGYYVFKPGLGTSGAANGKGTIGTGDDKTKALLFFPAVGFGEGTDLHYAGVNGYYWSGTLGSVDLGRAYCMLVYLSDIGLGVNGSRYRGFSVRPVSD